MILDAQHPLNSGRTSRSSLVRAYRGDRPEVTPVWFMRQAGRSLPEYRALRSDISMLDACLNPELACEITMQPVRRHRVDAAIFFSDIVVPLRLMGVPVTIVAGRGPVFPEAVRDADAVSQLTRLDPETLDSRAAPITEAVRRVVSALADHDAQHGAAEGAGTPLIGFAGAPFTLAAYLVEGGPSKDHLAARRLMHADPGAWAALMEWTAEVTGRFLRAQAAAGASAVQLFDSWAGALSLADYERHVAPASTRALSAVGGAVPSAHFGVGTGELLAAMHAAGGDVVGVDHRIPLDEAVRRLGSPVSVQGNLDPALLVAPWPVLATAVREVLRRGESARAHIFNLGHGVPPDTDPDVLSRIVELVHEVSADG